jgi:Asp-tRNA(Asn)/Glu-tRNA(Gln) amidotransferase A subunit family amidase
MDDLVRDTAVTGANALREGIAGGHRSAAEAVAFCLDTIRERDDQVQAWAFLDHDHARSQAAALDALRQSGRPIGTLHGVPVGIKDIIDTADQPTQNGTVVDTGRQPRRDATVVARLRAAGAVILGKTVTAECAYLAPGKTRNPHDPNRTPGGSSSGSAAAVASGMVPCAIGTQTGGSVIRPASYCGVIGFKPSFGLVPRTGVLRCAHHLDTLGTFTRNVEDAALLVDVMAGYDGVDVDTAPVAPPRLLETALQDPPVRPQFAFVRTPAWSELDDDSIEGFAELVDALGDGCDEVDLPPVFAEAAVAHRRIMLAEMSHNLRHYYDRAADQLAPATRAAVEEGRAISADEYLSALEWRDTLYAGLEEIFDRYDAIITPAATGAAPPGLESTGSAACNVLWSLTGVPAVTLPLLADRQGLPVGVQLIERRGFDGRLLRTARWLQQHLAELD